MLTLSLNSFRDNSPVVSHQIIRCRIPSPCCFSRFSIMQYRDQTRIIRIRRSNLGIYVGFRSPCGRWGKKVARGRYLEKVFTDKEEVLDIVEKAILLFREQGITGERFADTVERLGFENVQEQLLGDGLLARKDENIRAQKHLKGGATC